MCPREYVCVCARMYAQVHCMSASLRTSGSVLCVGRGMSVAWAVVVWVVCQSGVVGPGVVGPGVVGPGAAQRQARHSVVQESSPVARSSARRISRHASAYRPPPCLAHVYIHAGPLVDRLDESFPTVAFYRELSNGGPTKHLSSMSIKHVYKACLHV